MTLKVEGVVDRGMHAEEALGRSSRFETINSKNCTAWKPACQGVGYMTAILTAEDVVRRIAAECAYVDERGGVGIRRPQACNLPA